MRSRVVATLSAFVVTVALAVGVAPSPAAAAPSTPVFTSAPSGVVLSNHAAVSFYASGAVFFECRLDTGAFASCDSVGAHHVDGLAAGSHTIGVRGVDSASVRGPIASVTWTVSTDLQTITWLDRPTGTYPDRAAVATFTAALVDYYQCRVDSTADDAWRYCAGLDQGYDRLSDLASGPHSLDVRSMKFVSGVGNQFGPVAHTTFTTGSSMAITWLDKPTGVQPDRSVTARFSAARGDYYQCRLDSTADEAWRYCAGLDSGYDTLTDLAKGPHTLDVRMMEWVPGLGATEYGPVASTTFSIASPLTVTWVDRPSGTIVDRDVVAVFSQRPSGLLPVPP